MKLLQSLLFGITLTASLAWARPEVVFPKEAEVSNTAVISVFQVADLKEISGAAFTEIGRMSLVDKVEQQQSFVLSGEEVSKKMRDLVKSSTALQKINPSFRIPSEIHIKIRQDGISQNEVETSLRNMLAAKCDTCSFEIKVKSIPKVRAKNFEIVWDENVKGGAFMIPVREADQYTNKWITGTVLIRKTVPVARRLIRFGERVQNEDVELMDSNITYLKEDSPELLQVVGLIANKTITPKAPVLLSDLKREPAAKRGQVLKVLVGTDDFEVSTNGSAEENGFIGDTIKIKNSETQKIMSATVIDKGVVKIQ